MRKPTFFSLAYDNYILNYTWQPSQVEVVSQYAMEELDMTEEKADEWAEKIIDDGKLDHTDGFFHWYFINIMYKQLLKVHQLVVKTEVLHTDDKFHDISVESQSLDFNEL